MIFSCLTRDNQPAMKYDVHIWAPSTTSALLQASIATIETVRAGFPAADVHVTTDARDADSTLRLRSVTKRAGGTMKLVRDPLDDHTYLSETLLNPANRGTVVLLGPGVCCLDRCDGWRFDGLLAGRYVPAYVEATGCLSLPRLHPSFWWVPDADALRRRMSVDYARSTIGRTDPFVPYMFVDPGSGGWCRFGTGANLFETIKGATAHFSAAQLDCYDDWLIGIDGHALDERTSPSETIGRPAVVMKGRWKLQEEYFRSRAVGAGSQPWAIA